LVMEGWEDQTGAVRAAAARCGDHPEQFEFSRVADTIRFRLIRAEDVKPPFPGKEQGPPDVKLLTGDPYRSFIWLGTVKFTTVTGKPVVSELSTKPRDPELCIPVCPEPATKPEPELPVLRPVSVRLLLALGALLLLFGIVLGCFLCRKGGEAVPSSKEQES